MVQMLPKRRVTSMSKIGKKIGKALKKIYQLLDEKLITPISRAIYYLYEKAKDNPIHVEKLLNRPKILVYVSLVLAVVTFFLVDSQVITLVENEAEILSNEPVNVIYNKEAYVVEGLVENVDIILTGRKSALYLAKQLGEHEVVLDLSDYEASNTPVRVALSYNQTVDNINYKLDPAYVTVTIKKKVSEKRNISYELLNEEELVTNEGTITEELKEVINKEQTAKYAVYEKDALVGEFEYKFRVIDDVMPELYLKGSNVLAYETMQKRVEGPCNEYRTAQIQNIKWIIDWFNNYFEWRDDFGVSNYFFKLIIDEHDSQFQLIYFESEDTNRNHYVYPLNLMNYYYNPEKGNTSFYSLVSDGLYNSDGIKIE